MKLPTLAEDREAAIEAYLRLCIGHPDLRGDETICQLVAIGCAESGLDNMAVGRNDLNGTPEESHTSLGTMLHYSLGLGWLQHDSGWLHDDTVVNGVAWSIEDIRSDPAFSIDLLFRRPGMIRHQTPNRTYIDFDRYWAVYPEKSHPFLEDVENTYDRIAS